MSFKEWKDVVLGDIANYAKDKVSLDEITIYNYISTENMLPNKGGVSESSGLPNSKTVSKYECGDILISNIRPYFKKIWHADKMGGASNDVLIFKVNNKINNKYLFYCLNQDEFFDYMMQTAKGTKMPRGDKSAILNFEIKLPPIEEQKAIAKILSDLDNKIEVNNKINQRLEEMAQSIFKHWFVDFKFPNEEGKPYKSSGGEMFESELGMIPKGWEVKGLNSVAEFQNGYAFYKEGYSDKGIKVIDLANVNSLGNFVETDRDKYISYELYNKEKLIKYRLNKDDLIIIMTDRTQDMNILGKTAKIPYSNKFILNQRVGRLRAVNGINVNFLLSYMNSPVILEELKSISLGSVQKYFNTTHIKDLKFIIPNEKVMDLYSKYIDCIYNQMFVLNEEIIRLGNLRDTLLPKLMSGEIRVPVK